MRKETVLVFQCSNGCVKFLRTKFMNLQTASECVRSKKKIKILKWAEKKRIQAGITPCS